MEKCKTEGHDYSPLKEGYFKQHDRESSAVFNQTKSYTMLCCRRCGATMEVVSADYQP